MPTQIYSFFSGVGFLDLGFQNAGFDIAFVDEYDERFLRAYQYARRNDLHKKERQSGPKVVHHGRLHRLRSAGRKKDSEREAKRTRVGCRQAKNEVSPVDGPQIRNADDEKEAYRSGDIQKRLSLSQSKAFGNAAHK